MQRPDQSGTHDCSGSFPRMSHTEPHDNEHYRPQQTEGIGVYPGAVQGLLLAVGHPSGLQPQVRENLFDHRLHQDRGGLLQLARKPPATNAT